MNGAVLRAEAERPTLHSEQDSSGGKAKRKKQDLTPTPALTGMKTSLFNEAAVTAIHQGSGGFFRKANHLARGALVAAAADESLTVSPEHVRLASTEIF